MALLDQYGAPIQSEILREPQSAKLLQLHREFAGHPSRGLTPTRLASILQQAEQGNLQAQAELFADMEEKDSHLYAEMHKRKRAILTVDWEVRPPRNASAAEKTQADYLTELVQDIQGWDQLLLDALDAIGHGYACLEIEWQQSGKEWLPLAIKHRPPSWFMLNRDDQNDLRLRDNTENGAALTPFGWIVHKHRARTGVLARSGLHRILAWPFLFKNYAIRDLAELLEIYGLPIRLGKYPPGTGDAEKATLLRAVTSLGHAAAGIIPESMAIEFQAAADGNHDPFIAMVNWAEQSMSKAILGGTLTSQADGKSSTNALGQVHDAARREILSSDAKQLAATITRDLLYPLLVLNGQTVADPKRMPHLVFDVREEEDFSLLASALPDLVDLAVPVPISWVQRKLSIPAPQGKEPILGRSNALNKASNLAGLSAMQALAATNQQLQAPTTAELLGTQLESQAAEAWEAVLNHVEQLVQEAESFTALQTTLLGAYGGLPIEDLQKLMADALAVAQAEGMVDVKAELKADLKAGSKARS